MSTPGAPQSTLAYCSSTAQAVQQVATPASGSATIDQSQAHEGVLVWVYGPAGGVPSPSDSNSDPAPPADRALLSSLSLEPGREAVAVQVVKGGLVRLQALNIAGPYDSYGRRPGIGDGHGAVALGSAVYLDDGQVGYYGFEVTNQ